MVFDLRCVTGFENANADELLEALEERPMEEDEVTRHAPPLFLTT